MTGGSGSFGSRIVRLGILVLMLLLLLFAWQGQYRFQFGVPRTVGGKDLAAALVLLAVAWPLARRMGSGREHDAVDASAPTRRREWIAVALLCTLGTLLRLVHFETVPDGLNHDAAWYGMYAIHIVNGAEYTPYVAAAWGRETLFSYAIAALMPMLGNSPEAVQLASTLFGIAALIPMYLLARAMFGPRIGLLTLAFFAASGWHGVFSRAGWRVITLPPFACLAFYGLWKGMQTRRVGYWLLAGVSCGLAINTYNAGRVVPPMVALLFLLFALLRRGEWKAWLSGALAMGLAFLIVGGPMLWYAANNFEKWQGRAENLAEERVAESRTLSNWIDAFAMFNYRGNGNDFFVHEPLLEPLAAVLFVFGVASSLVGIRRRENLFVVLGLVLAVLPGVVSIPNGNRCVTAMPFVYLFIALGLSRFADCCGGLLSNGAQRRALVATLLVLTIVVAVVETYDEFLGRRRRSVLGFSAEATAAGEFMRPYMGTHKVYAVSGSWPEYTLTYLSYNGEGDPLERHFVFARSFREVEGEIDRFGKKGLLFVFGNDPAGTEAAARVAKMFAEHRVQPITARRLGGSQVAQALFVDAESLSKSQPWSNVSRTLLLHEQPGGPPAASGRICFAPVGGASGVSTRVQLMVPEISEAAVARGVRWLADCSAERDRRSLFELAFTPEGLVARRDGSIVLVPRERIEPGHWYEIDTIVSPGEGRIDVVLDGRRVAAGKGLRLSEENRFQVSGIEVWGDQVNEASGQLYVDNVTVLGERMDPADRRWARGQRGELPAYDQDFEDMPFGPVAVGGEWKDVRGAVSVVAGPNYWGQAGQAVGGGTNAFDGGRGAGPGQFDEPMGVALVPGGDFFVSDRLNHRVQKFASDGTFLGAWGKLGDGAGEFREPHDLAASDGALYVADTWNQRIQVFDWNGTFMFQIKDTPPLASPRGIFARAGRIYLADSGNGVARVFDRSGKLLLTLGEKGSGPGQMSEPVDVAADSKGRIYVLNSGNNRMEMFESSGQPAGSFPIPNWTGPYLKESYLAIDAADVIYMSDWDTGRVRRFKTNGTELPAIGPTVSRPSGLDTDGARVLFSARGDHRVRAVTVEQVRGTALPRPAMPAGRGSG
jgi:DNA-binding beta-propeller fold protein YncE